MEISPACGIGSSRRNRMKADTSLPQENVPQNNSFFASDGRNARPRFGWPEAG
jgi:hypothetical protein